MILILFIHSSTNEEYTIQKVLDFTLVVGMIVSRARARLSPAFISSTSGYVSVFKSYIRVILSVIAP